MAVKLGDDPIRFILADATNPELCHLLVDKSSIAPSGPPQSVCHLLDDKFSGGAPEGAGGKAFDGVLLLFNGLMQIPGRRNRRAAMRGLHRVCQGGAPFLFTTHDRDDSENERPLWEKEREAWRDGQQDTRLAEFGDRYMESPEGRIFMHLPDQREILEDLAATGWKPEFTAMRREIVRERRRVREFSDECRFWVTRRVQEPACPSTGSGP